MTRKPRGLPTRWMLVASVVLVITGTICSSLWVVRNRLQEQVLHEFSSDLLQSAAMFRASDAERLATLKHENALLADLPSLKALMTTGDEATIVDGGIRFWTVAGSDLFALANSDGQIVAAYTRGTPPSKRFRIELARVLGSDQKHFLLADGRLFEFSVQPLFFGTEKTGTLLGYVITGYSVDSAPVRQTTSVSPAETAFLSRGVVTSTLPRSLWPELGKSYGSLTRQQGPATIMLGRHRYLMSLTDLTDVASEPLVLVVMKSFAHAEQARRELNTLLIGVGFFALCAGTVLMLAISGLITAPLEQLTRSVREYSKDVTVPVPPSGGTREVRELSGAFFAMGQQLREKSRALLESERLATIGRMASSVSHDLRHYLAAVYANAEFLIDPRLSSSEREELFEEIRTAVHGTTDLIESLLIFSRSSPGAPRSPANLSHILDRAITLVKAHPDAQGIQVRTLPGVLSETEVLVDVRQMERALFNLLLNACQAARGSVGDHCVTAHIEIEAPMVKVEIVDDGAGVADAIRESLFQPFVSEGKQNGTGLGLTMAHAVALEHGGSVDMLRSRPGETVFVLSLAQTGREQKQVAVESCQESPR